MAHVHSSFFDDSSDESDQVQTQYPDPEENAAYPWLGGQSSYPDPEAYALNPAPRPAQNHYAHSAHSAVPPQDQGNTINPSLSSFDERNVNPLLDRASSSEDESEDDDSDDPVNDPINVPVDDNRDQDFVLDSSDGDSGELSDADSDTQQLKNEINKFKKSLNEFRTSRRDIDDSSDSAADTRNRGKGRSKGRGGRGGRDKNGNRIRRVVKGPRKAAALTGDVKLRLSRASQAFLDQSFEEARDICFDIVRINAETFEAWMLLAQVYGELGDIHNQTLSMVYACHLRPKNISLWLETAAFALEETGPDRKNYLPTAKLCFSQALRVDSKHTQARLGKAAVSREMGHIGTAIAIYRQVLSQAQPHDTSILQSLAEMYIDQKKPAEARDLYKETVAFYMSKSGPGSPFAWSDVNIYIELYAYCEQYEEGITELKKVSRWLLGRKEQTYWDSFTEDDREYDADDTRRQGVASFRKNAFDSDRYGEGLPMELRVKLGLYRLQLGNFDEAMLHFAFLQDDEDDDRMLQTYPDLFKEAGDGLHKAERYSEALKFYEPLQTPEFQDASLHVKSGECYLKLGSKDAAEESWQTAIQLDENNIEARMNLANMYEELGEQQTAFIFVSEVLTIKRQQNGGYGTTRTTSKNSGGDGAERERESQEQRKKPGPKPQSSKAYKPKRITNPAARAAEEEARAERLREQYDLMKTERDRMRAGDPESTRVWMNAARELVTDFRSFKAFYPWDRYLHFLGYAGPSRAGASPAEAPSPDNDVEAMATRLAENLHAEMDPRDNVPAHIPDNYRGIPFSEWLDIFLEYAICLTKEDSCHEAYEVCEAAKDAIVWYHNRDDTFLIHLCWCACALYADDEESVVAVGRFFMKNYQFTTDSYRMFATLIRLCHSPISWYTSGPSQKFVMRQIKAMDYSLVTGDDKENFGNEKGGYSAKDENGHLVINEEMDVCLLMLYGHILFTNTTYAYAINYFIRAYAHDPNNPMILLSLALAYIHHALKRQAENRQHLLLQGLTFLHRYHDMRSASAIVDERKEANYNVARAYHLLGLTHLAIPYYMKVLQEAEKEEGNGGDGGDEDVVTDAAYNLQNLYFMTGNLELTRGVGERWLVL